MILTFLGLFYWPVFRLFTGREDIFKGAVDDF